MPGYVIHMAQAYRIADALAGKGKAGSAMGMAPAAWREAFVTGNLLPDTRLKAEKGISHFWNPADGDKIAKAPDLSLFLDKYRDRLEDPVVLGYLCHLQLDALYVQRFWPQVLTFLGRDGTVQERSSRICRVQVHRQDCSVPVADFFSEKYYYGDYTKMNAYFMDKYGLRPPAWEGISDFPIREVRLADMALICQELGILRERCHSGDEKDLKVFDLAHLEAFMEEAAADFLTDERWAAYL